MSAATQQAESVDRVLPLTAHEVRMLDHVLDIVTKKPTTFGVRGNGQTEIRDILIQTAQTLRSKLGTPPPAPLAKTKPKEKPKKEKDAAAATQPAPPVLVPSPFEAPAIPAPAAPAAAAAEPPAKKKSGTKHFLVVYSRTKGKPVAERPFASPEEALNAQRTEAAKWPDEYDVETHVISGPNRDVLVSAQPRFFRARPPKAMVRS